MRKIFLALLLSVVCAGQGRAQDIYYELWLDDYRLGLQNGWLAEGEQIIQLDATAIPTPGLHFLNIIPYDESGEMGVWSRIAFLMPEGWPDRTEATAMEYWIDDNRQLGARKEFTATEQSFSFDISNMTYGLHFLNYRTFNGSGEAGAWNRIAFYISNGSFDAEQITYEYWIDNGEHTTGKGFMAGKVPLSIETAGLKDGKHTFYFRACNSSGTYGEHYSAVFELPGVILGDANNDGKVTITDAVGIVNDILGNPSGNFNETAADVNRDENITITDAVGVVNIILNSGASGAPKLEVPDVEADDEEAVEPAEVGEPE